MKDGNENRKENSLFNVCAANKIKMKTENEDNVLFFCNDYLLSKVNRQELLEKSAYFRAILKTCYTDHRSDSIEVNIPASFGVFNKIMEFVDTGIITLDIDTVLETCHLAIYLQIDYLPRICLDHFTNNLSLNTIESQLHLMTNYSYLDEELKVRALMFRESSNPSFSGLCFLEDIKRKGRKVGKYLNIFSKQLGSVYLISELKQTKFSSLLRFDHMLCSLVPDGFKMFLFQYNLVSGNTNMLVIENYQSYNGFDMPTICSNGNKLFVNTKVTNENDECLLSLSVFRNKTFTDSLEMCKKKTFKIFSHIKYKNSKMWFSHCYEEKLYVFYSCYKHQRTYGGGCYPSGFAYNSNDLYLLTICIKSFDILKNQKLAEVVKLDKDVNLRNFEKMLYDRKQEKLYILEICFYYYEPWEQVLVFDMKNDSFYFVENFLPSSYTDCSEFKFTFGKDGKVYGVRQYRSKISKHEFHHWTEIRAFQLENDKLVDGGVKWKNFEVSTSKDYPEITSACFV